MEPAGVAGTFGSLPPSRAHEHSLPRAATGRPFQLRHAAWDPPLSPNAWLRWEVVHQRLPREATSVLEIGCGQGGFAARLARRYRYVGVEPDPVSFAVAQGRVGLLAQLRNGDVTTVRREEQFDLVCAFEVLEHVPDDEGALAAWAEHVRPGGMLMLSVPAWRERFAAADAMVGHVRRYDPDDIATLLRGAGLDVVEVTAFGAPVGYLLEAVRNLIGKQRAGITSRESLEALTAGSGRLLQPREGLVAAGVYLLVLPFRKLQRSFPNRGPGLLAIARRPQTTGRSR